MIKATAAVGGDPVLILGLSGENMARLMAGEPIVVDPRELGLDRLPARVVLVGGRTEDTIKNDLEKRFSAPPSPPG